MATPVLCRPNIQNCVLSDCKFRFSPADVHLYFIKHKINPCQSGSITNNMGSDATLKICEIV